MIKFFRNLRSLAIIAVLTTLNMTAAQVVWGLSVSRIIPQGTVKVYEGDRVVQVLSEEAPFPEGLMLENEGQCAAHLDNFYLVAIDKSRFGISDTAGEFRLVLEQGTTYFALSSLSGNLIFETPNGEFPAKHILINTSSNGGLIKGYVTTKPDKTEIGVLEGGSMVVATNAGDQKIETGRQITIAQAILDDEEQGQAVAEAGQNEEGQAQAQNEEDEKIPATYYVLGGLAAAGVVAGAVALGGGGGGGGGSSGGGNDSVSPTN
jgi:hypothetical protein